MGQTIPLRVSTSGEDTDQEDTSFAEPGYPFYVSSALFSYLSEKNKLFTKISTDFWAVFTENDIPGTHENVRN
jgi:hypothetical protein